MASTDSLLTLVSGEFRGDVVNQIASGLGENPTATRTAIGGALPALIAGLVKKCSTNQGATDVFDLLQNNQFDGRHAVSAASAVAETDGMSHLVETGNPLVSSVLGQKAGSVTDWLSSMGGIRKTSALSLLSLAAPIVLGSIGRQVRGLGWNVSSLKNFMGAQRGLLRNAPPGLANVIGAEEEVIPPSTRSTAEVYREPARTRSSAWTWAIPLLALLGLLMFFFSRRQPSNAARAVVAGAESVTARIPTPALPAPVNLGELIPITLPNGAALRVPSNGVEAQLVNFIKDPSQPVDANKWFTFDRLEFETGSATLKPSSEEQLRNISGILKAYPNVTLKIGGYTDNVGDAAKNLTLSQERATNTMNELVRLGAPANRLTAEGFGDQHPVADNTTDTGRQKNRRIDLSVIKK